MDRLTTIRRIADTFGETCFLHFFEDEDVIKWRMDDDYYVMRKDGSIARANGSQFVEDECAKLIAEVLK